MHIPTSLKNNLQLLPEMLRLIFPVHCQCLWYRFWILVAILAAFLVPKFSIGILAFTFDGSQFDSFLLDDQE